MAGVPPRANPHITGRAQSWQFGGKADLLSALVLRGEKTATSSAHALYAAEGEPLPRAGTFHVIEDSGGRAVCIIETTRVCIEAFCRVSAAHAAREGEGDKSLGSVDIRLAKRFFEEKSAYAMKKAQQG